MIVLEAVDNCFKKHILVYIKHNMPMRIYINFFLFEKQDLIYLIIVYRKVKTRLNKCSYCKVWKSWFLLFIPVYYFCSFYFKSLINVKRCNAVFLKLFKITEYQTIIFVYAELLWKFLRHVVANFAFFHYCYL